MALYPLSLNFKSAVHRVSHEYRHYLPEQYGFDGRLIILIQALHTTAASRRQNNGHLCAAFPIGHGCLPMLVYIIVIYSLLIMPDKIAGLTLGTAHRKACVSHS